MVAAGTPAARLRPCRRNHIILVRILQPPSVLVRWRLSLSTGLPPRPARRDGGLADPLLGNSGIECGLDPAGADDEDDDHDYENRSQGDHHPDPEGGAGGLREVDDGLSCVGTPHVSLRTHSYSVARHPFTETVKHDSERASRLGVVSPEFLCCSAHPRAPR